MAKAGRPPKPDATRQRSHGRNPGRSPRKKDLPVAVVAEPPKQMKVPPAPRGLSPVVAAAWVTYWSSDISSAARDVDLQAFGRLFYYYDQWHRFRALLDELGPAGQFAEGSTHQLVMHPAVKNLHALDNLIGGLEAEFGLTPLSRQRLGLTAAQNRLTAEQINAMATRREKHAARNTDVDEDDAQLADWEPA